MNERYYISSAALRLIRRRTAIRTKVLEAMDVKCLDTCYGSCLANAKFNPNLRGCVRNKHQPKLCTATPTIEAYLCQHSPHCPEVDAMRQIAEYLG